MLKNKISCFIWLLKKLPVSLHQHLKQERLRGGMVALARVNANHNSLQFCGVGDVSCRVFADKSTSLLTADGVVGESLRRKLITHKIDVPEKAIIALFSDGISSRIDIPEDLKKLNLIELVHLLTGKYSRDDDKTLLIARLHDVQNVWTGMNNEVDNNLNKYNSL